MDTRRNRQCQGVTKTGKQCTARASSGSLYCAFHDPERAEERREWSRKGGKASSTQKRLSRLVRDADVLTARELMTLLSGAMLMLLEDDLEPAQLNALASAAKTVDSIRTSSDIQQRLDELEAALNARGPGPHRVASW